MFTLEGKGVFKLVAFLFLSLCSISIGITYGDSNYVSYTYEFITDQSNVVQTGGIAGIHEIYPIEGHFQLYVDFNTEEASFELVDANLLQPTGFLPTENLGELFNMTELTGTVFGNTVIVFWGEVSDNPETNVLITVVLSDDLAYIYGKTIPPACCDYFYFEMNAVAKKKYSGGTGESDNPYQIATAEDLITLGETPEDYDMHFILTADIDMDPNLPGGQVFTKAVIAPFINPEDMGGVFKIIPFTGFFNGNNHKISNLRIEGQDYLGLFGILGSNSIIKDLGIEDVDINSSGYNVGALAGSNGDDWSMGNSGIVTRCYSTGSVRGTGVVGTGTGWAIGGLIGINHKGQIIYCYSSASVNSSGNAIGGLVGYNNNGASVTQCYTIADVNGSICAGGLVGSNGGAVVCCYSTGTVSGIDGIGGLVGSSSGSIVTSYSNCEVSGDIDVGGLVGEGNNSISIASFWNIETSGQTTSTGGTGLTTSQMQDSNIFLNAGWDCVDEVVNGVCDYWQIVPGDYPTLRYSPDNGPVMPEGSGTVEQPYLIRCIRDLGTIWYEPTSHYRLEASLDLSGIKWSMAVIPWFNGTFDGNGYIIRNLNIKGGGYLGLFGQSGSNMIISNLGLEMVDVNGTGYCIGGLIGFNNNLSSITTCYSTDSVISGYCVGGLVGENCGTLTDCYSVGEVSGGLIGGLIGLNEGLVTNCYSTSIVNGTGGVGGLIGYSYGSITNCYSTGAVCGSSSDVGGFVGRNEGFGIDGYGNITSSYSTSMVSGYSDVGGFVGSNGGSVSICYSTGIVTGNQNVGGFSGVNYYSIIASFWDTEKSGINIISDGGLGLTTSQMKDPNIYSMNGWGGNPNWVLDPGNDYPRLVWEGIAGQTIPEPVIDWFDGSGTQEDPYIISTADQFISIRTACILWDKCFTLVSDLDLTEVNISTISVLWPYIVFEGIFNGNDHIINDIRGIFSIVDYDGKINNLVFQRDEQSDPSYICYLAETNYGTISECSANCNLVVRNSGTVINCFTTGNLSVGNEIQCRGGLVNSNSGSIINCFSTMNISGGTGSRLFGGLVGFNEGSIINCFATGNVSAGEDSKSIGGLCGWFFYGIISNCYSTGTVSGRDGSSNLGGLCGNISLGNISNCYSTGNVSGVGTGTRGGLVGYNNNQQDDYVVFSFWDVETSGQSESAGGTGLTTVEMQTESTFTDAGWDFMGETDNGSDDIWWIDEGNDYPRLWWESVQSEE